MVSAKIDTILILAEADFLHRAIARDPELFPDPDAFNPMRWLEPKYPSYREPLTEHPSIINITQFGYGRRLCQGQAVADEDLFIGLGALAWLFDIKKNTPAPTTEVTPASPIGTAYTNEKASISTEELSTGVYADDRKDSVVDTDSILATSTEYAAAAAAVEDARDAATLTSPVSATTEKAPGAWPIRSADAAAQAEWEQAQEKPKKKKTVDPTLDYTHLLIAKPVPFEFSLRVRDGFAHRKELVERLFAEKKAEGEFPEGRSYWGEGKEAGQYGWVKV